MGGDDFRRSFRRTLLVGIAIGGALGSGNNEITRTESVETLPALTAPPTQPTATISVPRTGPARSEYAIGDTLRESRTGRTVTLVAYEQPWTSSNQFTKPKTGFSYATIDVKGCAGSEDDAFGFNPFSFGLAMADSTRIEPALAAREPRLASGPLAANDCVRGWIVFEVPTGQRAEFVVYSTTFSTAKWRVPA